ncbi:hypothetical protein LTR37_015487 [Vermiconidia calcicola]|uniref:Uncharacterized protein n=1 Tax=Vermiconidia calcicola TaxID=1690605 RepID=A0ACC3MT70_9PEZI|nr:hypothetical protein LTR37_015487 [Vermiconidia calcicola]
MSKSSESASDQNPGEESERGSQQESAQPTVYQAKYHADEESRIPGSYIVEFHPGHTIAKHFAFLGREFELTALDQGYFADDIDDDLFNAIRRDPGVKYMEDDCLGLPVGSGETSNLLRHRLFYQAQYYPYERERVPGIYMVALYPGHTIAKHFAFLGREFELTSLNEGYFADMNDGLFNAVRRDPGVRFIEDDVTGGRDGEPAQHAATPVHEAEYYPFLQDRVPGAYIVEFNAGHSIAKHFAFIGREFELTTLDQGYYADLDDDLFSTVRRDPGVKYLEDDILGVPFGVDEI